MPVIEQLLALYTNNHSLVILLNANDRDIEYFCAPARASSTPSNAINQEFFTNVTGMTVQKRATIYESGGVFYGPSRMFIADFLNNNINIPKISCLVVVNAETIQEDSQEAFILYRFKEINSPGLILAFSNGPLRIASSSLYSVAKTLCISRAVLYPRFHLLLKESLEEIKATVVNVKQNSFFEEMLVVFVDLLKRMHGADTFSATDYSLRLIHLFYTPVTTKNCAQKMLARLIAVLFSADIITFYFYYLQIIEFERRMDNRDSWIFSPESITLLQNTEEYLVSRMNISVTEIRHHIKAGASAPKEGGSSENDEETDEPMQAEPIEDSKYICEMVGSYEFFMKHPKFKKLYKILEEHPEKHICIIVQNTLVKHSVQACLNCLPENSAVEILTISEFEIASPESEVFILMAPSLKSIRILERLGTLPAVHGQPMKIYILLHRNSLEEQIYLAEVAEEKHAFEKLASESVNLPSRPDLEVLDMEDPDEEKTYEISVDVRELRARLPFYLYKARNKIIVSSMETGDYIFGNWCLERKSIEDFRGSLDSGRLYQQSLRIVHSTHYPVLLVEFESGHPTLLAYENRDEFRNTLISKFCLFLQTFSQFKVLWSNSNLFSARLIRDLHKKGGRHQHVDLKIDPALQEMLLSIPGITIFSIRRVIGEFENIEDMAFAPMSRLLRVLESENAQKVYDFFRSSIA